MSRDTVLIAVLISSAIMVAVQFWASLIQTGMEGEEYSF